jgi:1L-myo-inositol 1-phosphate cytidylyltransferase / CDP-L-myo-inositol myo-inositolphosphotransferase
MMLIIVGDEKDAVVPVFGNPAVRRLALLARQLASGAVHIVGSNPVVRSILSDLVPPENFHADTELGETRGLIDRMGVGPDDRIMVMRANHAIDAGSLRRLLQAGMSGGVHYCDNGTNSADWSGRVWLADGDRFAGLLETLKTPGQGSPEACSAGKVPSAPGLPAMTHYSTTKSAGVEDSLMNAVALATRDHDSFLARCVNRRLSRPLSRALTRTGVTANMVTIVNVVLGLTGAFLLSGGEYWPQVIGALLFLSSIILDGVDGELARLKLQESKLGHYLDIIGDNLVHVAVFAGIAFGLYRSSGDSRYLEVLAILLGGFAVCAVAVQKALGHGPERRGAGDGPLLTTLLANRDFAYLVVAFALIGRLNWFRYATAAGAYLFALALFIVDWRQREGTRNPAVRIR